MTRIVASDVGSFGNLLGDLAAVAAHAHRFAGAALVVHPPDAPLCLPDLAFRLRRTTIEATVDVATERGLGFEIGATIGARLRHTLLDVGFRERTARLHRVSLTVDAAPPAPVLQSTTPFPPPR